MVKKKRVKERNASIKIMNHMQISCWYETLTPHTHTKWYISKGWADNIIAALYGITSNTFSGLFLRTNIFGQHDYSLMGGNRHNGKYVMWMIPYYLMWITANIFLFSLFYTIISITVDLHIQIYEPLLPLSPNGNTVIDDITRKNKLQ